jgi:DNA adenine methylase
MNAPIRYFGGKGSMYNSIIKYFPKTGSYDTYIEPFGGSYAIGLKKDITPIEIYNDLDKNVYSLYKVLSDSVLFEEFKNRCDLSLYSEELRKEYKLLLKDTAISVIDRAFYFFYVNRTSHNGIGGFSTNVYIRRKMSKSVSDFLSAIDRLPELHQRLSNMIILNKNGIDVIEKYNNEKIFIYCDPPYEQTTRTSVRYDVDMDNTTQIRFIDTIINSKSKIIVSGYDCELYNKLVENGFEKIQFNVNMTSGGKKTKAKVKTETLWKNY